MRKAIVFSPTGGTKNVINIMFPDVKEHEIIKLEEPHATCDCCFSQEDLCIVAVPSYGGRVPQTVLARIQNIQGNGAKAVLVVVYGNRAYEDTLIELQDFMEAHGFACVASVAAIAQHSIMSQFAQGRPDNTDMENLASFGKQILLASEKVGAHLQVPGNHPYKELHVMPMVPHPNDACNSCMACAKVCPMSAISFLDPSVVEEQNCISCMRCVTICPSHARNVKEELLKGAVQKLAPVCTIRKEAELFLAN